MKKLTFDFQDFKKLEINGIIFDILKADAEILEQAQKLRSKYGYFAGKDKNNITDEDLNAVVEAVKEIVSSIDEILGAGAVKKIVQDRPLGIVDALRLLAMVCQAVVEEYNSDMKEKYDDSDE